MKKETKAQTKNREANEALNILRGVVDANTRIYCILRRVSASGMNRKISFVINDAGTIRDITWLMGRALGFTMVDVNGDWALSVTGCGMDMGFSVCHLLWRKLGIESQNYGWL